MIIRLERAIGAFILAITLLTIISGCQHYFGAAHAATYYVATTGSDSNPGTEKQPWRTIAYSVDSMVPGDSVYVKGGVYNEETIRFRRSGTQSAPIKLLNAPGESPVIHCIDPKQYHRIVLHHASGSRFPIGWITIEGFEIRNCWEGIKGYNIHDSTIRRNWIHHNLNQGLLGSGGTRNLIDRNIFNHNGNFAGCTSCTKQHGIYANGTAWTITNNLIYDNLGYGIQLNGSASYDSAKYPSPEFAVSHNWIIANNTIAYNVHRGGMVVWGSTCLNARIENNIFYENAVASSSGSGQAIDFTGASNATGITIRNNHAYASGSGGQAFTAGTTPTGAVISGNIVNVNAPGFVNAGATLPESPNFSLTERSPAIDAGLTIMEARIAFDGTTRPQGRAYDIGAYEFGVGNDTKSPARPAGLQVR